MRDKLNSAKVRTLTKAGTYGDGGGLYLQVRSPQNRSWIFRYMRQGKAYVMGFGPEELVGLAEARKKALEARRMLLEGQDPLDARRAHKAAQDVANGRSFRAVAEAYIEAHRDGWKNVKHQQQWANTLASYVYPKAGHKPVAEITVGNVMDVLQPIWNEKPETASRVRGRIEAVLDFAAARGWRTGDNPARWKGHLDNLLPSRAKLAAVAHHVALPYRDMDAFWQLLATQEGVSALALRLLILTATRTSEVLMATWGEFDLEAQIWTIPAARMKAGKEHRVPLCDLAQRVLLDVAAIRTDAAPTAFVFPGSKQEKPLSNMALLMLLRRMGRADLTAHGFRSTFRDWAGETTGYQREVIEHALSHQLKDKAEAAYQRGDLLEKRRRLMTDWGSYLMGST